MIRAIAAWHEAIGGRRVGDRAFAPLAPFLKALATTKNDGTNSTAKQVDAIIPVKTAIPIDLRALAPAPVASTSGKTPRMKANDVIRIGAQPRPRRLDGRLDDGLAFRPNSRATSTMRMAFLADKAIRSTSPIWT